MDALKARLGLDIRFVVTNLGHGSNAPVLLRQFFY